MISAVKLNEIRFSAMKLDEIGLSGKESDFESLQMLHRIRLLHHWAQKFLGQNHQAKHRDRQGVDQRGSPWLQPFFLYVGCVWSNHYNLNIRLIFNKIVNNKHQFIVL